MSILTVLPSYYMKYDYSNVIFNLSSDILPSKRLEDFTCIKTQIAERLAELDIYERERAVKLDRLLRILSGFSRLRIA